MHHGKILNRPADFFSMALVNIAIVIADTRRALKKIDPPGGVELLSYKRNRTIAVIKKNSNLLRVRERGYKEQEIELHYDQLGKELKIMIKREFPRSRKVRLVKFSDPQQLERIHQKI